MFLLIRGLAPLKEKKMSCEYTEAAAESLWEEVCGESAKLFPESEWESPACLAWEEARFQELWEQRPDGPDY